jgi:putative Mg2+ transporter-C (MgtC) family protein
MESLDIPFGQASLRLLAAALLGAVLGWDREAHNKPAGVRTFMMVAIGSAGFALIAKGMADAVVQVAGDPVRFMDPTRIIQGIIGGIGFIGAGAIIQSQGRAYGITTAAGIWLTAAVGIAAGLGGYVLAVVLTAFGIVVLVVMGLITGGRRQNNNDTDS